MPHSLPAPAFDDPKHHLRLYQGDCLEILAAIPESSVDLVFADPPYFLSNGGITCHAGKMVSVHKGDWDKSKGPDANHAFNTAWLAACQRVLKPHGSIWVGCNILLDKIPVHARISVVSEGVPHTPREVRGSYNRLRPLEKLQVAKRGWTLDVLQVVQSLGKLEFTLADVYAHAGALAKLHPNNAHVRDKIRQQLQVLRDLGLLTFLGSASYRLA
jgi:hypothetical protein